MSSIICLHDGELKEGIHKDTTTYFSKYHSSFIEVPPDIEGYDIRVGHDNIVKGYSYNNYHCGNYCTLKLGNCNEVHVGDNCVIECNTNCEIYTGDNCNITVSHLCSVSIGKNCSVYYKGNDENIILTNNKIVYNGNGDKNDGN
jgi:hypothetical protein